MLLVIQTKTAKATMMKVIPFKAFLQKTMQLGILRKVLNSSLKKCVSKGPLYISISLA